MNYSKSIDEAKNHEISKFLALCDDVNFVTDMPHKTAHVPHHDVYHDQLAFHEELDRFADECDKEFNLMMENDKKQQDDIGYEMNKFLIENNYDSDYDEQIQHSLSVEEIKKIYNL